MSVQLSSHCLKATEPYCMISWRPSLDKMSPFLLMTFTAGMPRTPKALFNSLEKLNCKNICYGQHFRKLCLCFQARSFLIGCWICFVYFWLRKLFLIGWPHKHIQNYSEKADFLTFAKLIDKERLANLLDSACIPVVVVNFDLQIRKWPLNLNLLDYCESGTVLSKLA